MIRALTLVHRWLSVPCCLLFAMWFASGIVMHFVPFPAPDEAQRVAGLAPVDFARIRHGPREAVAASGIADAARVRLVQRSDGPVYVVSGGSRGVALHGSDLSPAAVQSASLALAIAVDHARRRGLEASAAAVAGSARYDQWTVAGGFDRHRPLWRIARNDREGTELYVSSGTGEVVQQTTRRERWWNYAGSVAHWIYPTILRGRPVTWTAIMWAISFIASIAALAGTVLGLARAVPSRGRITPYGGWHALHHVLGLACATFVLAWIISGWLSMDSGLLFSSGRVSASEAALFAAPAWEVLPRGPPRATSAQVKETEWFFVDGKPYRRDRADLETQLLVRDDFGPAASQRTYLTPDEVTNGARRLAPSCGAARVHAADAYAAASSMAGAPVYRITCGSVWFQVDGASGALLERLDASRRAYRWLFDAPHRLDVPYLTARPRLRDALVVILCGCGFAFSLTGCVIAWRRSRAWLEAGGRRSRG